MAPPHSPVFQQKNFFFLLMITDLGIVKSYRGCLHQDKEAVIKEKINKKRSNQFAVGLCNAWIDITVWFQPLIKTVPSPQPGALPHRGFANGPLRNLNCFQDIFLLCLLSFLFLVGDQLAFPRTLTPTITLMTDGGISVQSWIQLYSCSQGYFLCGEVSVLLSLLKTDFMVLNSKYRKQQKLRFLTNPLIWVWRGLPLAVQ